MRAKAGSESAAHSQQPSRVTVSGQLYPYAGSVEVFGREGSSWMASSTSRHNWFLITRRTQGLSTARTTVWSISGLDTTRWRRRASGHLRQRDVARKWAARDEPAG
jgi:hypothetical protein